MFISGDPSQAGQVLDIAWKYLFIMACCLCILYFLHVYRSALQGLGNTFIPMLSGVVEFVVRVGVAVFLPFIMGTDGIFMLKLLPGQGLRSFLLSAIFLQ